MWARYPEVPAEKRSGNASFAAIPLSVEGRTIGAIGLSFKLPHLFDAADRALALALAQQCAQVLERTRLFESERCARESAERAMRQRDQFISIASHELKTPLTTIKGYAELLVQRGEEAKLNEQHQRMLRAVHQQSVRLEKMISLLLDISRLDKGQFVVERELLNLNALVASIVQEFEPTLRKHQLTFVSRSGELMIEGEQLRLEQVIHNLIQNAIKYSPLGGDISVVLERKGDRARISVTDHGIGIPAEALPQLFTRFYRAKNADAYHISGFGVGLYVVREIVRLHGGDITVESEEGKGATFHVWLPLAATSG